jgi:hypothetical protein
MQMKSGNYCPLIKKKCIEHKCAWFTLLRGLNPNTGAEIDEWACAVAWMPLMAVEVAQKENDVSLNNRLYLKTVDSFVKNATGIVSVTSPSAITGLNTSLIKLGDFIDDGNN